MTSLFILFMVCPLNMLVNLFGYYCNLWWMTCVNLVCLLEPSMSFYLLLKNVEAVQPEFLHLVDSVTFLNLMSLLT